MQICNDGLDFRKRGNVHPNLKTALVALTIGTPSLAGTNHVLGDQTTFLGIAEDPGQGDKDLARQHW
jgi:hypothetical protein